MLQAKFRRQGAGTKDLAWLQAELRKEFAAWTDPSAARVKRGRLPQFMIVVTNVRLTSTAGTGGIDRAKAALAEYGKKLGYFPPPRKPWMPLATDNCGAGQGPDAIDALTPTLAWVENGVAPDQLVATKRQDDTVVRTRPVYPYPTVARFDGTGSIDDAANLAPAPPPTRYRDDIPWLGSFRSG